MNIGRDYLDVQLKAVVKSNLVCGDSAKIEEMMENIVKDIIHMIDEYIQANLDKESE